MGKEKLFLKYMANVFLQLLQCFVTFLCFKVTCTKERGAVFVTLRWRWCMVISRQSFTTKFFNLIALIKAKIVRNFGLNECTRVK